MVPHWSLVTDEAGAVDEQTTTVFRRRQQRGRATQAAGGGSLFEQGSGSLCTGQELLYRGAPWLDFVLTMTIGHYVGSHFCRPRDL